MEEPAKQWGGEMEPMNETINYNRERDDLAGALLEINIPHHLESILMRIIIAMNDNNAKNVTGAVQLILDENGGDEYAKSVAVAFEVGWRISKIMGQMETMVDEEELGTIINFMMPTMPMERNTTISGINTRHYSRRLRLINIAAAYGLKTTERENPQHFHLIIGQHNIAYEKYGKPLCMAYELTGDEATDNNHCCPCKELKDSKKCACGIFVPAGAERKV